MLIELKNKDTLIVGDFKFKCCIGKSGLNKQKIEGDKSTPIGLFKIGKLYFREDRFLKPSTLIEKKVIKCWMGWSNDSKSKNYNSEVRIKKNTKYEKLFREDYKYDYLIVINYNDKKIPYKGSAIFLHLTSNYKPTAGCIAIKKKDFEILLKLINNKTKIRIS
jgi:L,D-peptidoglycan transpeptidase YkuD (ErfK/YbiS/YcfS/YnhG family)